MSCFPLAWVENILIWLVIIGAVFAVVQLLLPRVLNPLGEFATLVLQILRIVVWAAVVIWLIILLFDLASCALGGPRLLHR